MKKQDQYIEFAFVFFAYTIIVMMLGVSAFSIVNAIFTTIGVI